MNKYIIPSIGIYHFKTEFVVASSAAAVDAYMRDHNVPVGQRAEVDWDDPKMKEVRNVLTFD